MTNEINLLHTSCKHCTFSIYKDKTQTDCYLGLINQYQNNQIEILEAYDEDKEFFVVNNKKCLAYVQDSFFNKHESLKDLSLEEKAEYVRSKLRIKYAIVLNIKQYSPAELQIVFEEISKLEIEPTTVYLIRYKEDREKFSYKFLERIIKKWKLPNWKIKTILDPEDEYLSVLHYTINENKKNKFVLSINGDYTDMGGIIDRGQKIIYDDSGSFVVISNQSKETILFSTEVYRYGIINGIDILSEYEKYDII